MGVGDAIRARWDQLSAGRESAVRDGIASLDVSAHLLAPNDLQQRLTQYASVACHVVQLLEDHGALDGLDNAIAFRMSSTGTLKTALEQARGERFPLKPLAEWIRLRTDRDLSVFVTARQYSSIASSAFLKITASA